MCWTERTTGCGDLGRWPSGPFQGGPPSPGVWSFTRSLEQSPVAGSLPSPPRRCPSRSPRGAPPSPRALRSCPSPEPHQVHLDAGRAGRLGPDHLHLLVGCTDLGPKGLEIPAHEELGHEGRTGMATRPRNLQGPSRQPERSGLVCGSDTRGLRRHVGEHDVEWPRGHSLEQGICVVGEDVEDRRANPGLGERLQWDEIHPHHQPAWPDGIGRDLQEAARGRPRSRTRAPGRSRWKRRASSSSLKALRARKPSCLAR